MRQHQRAAAGGTFRRRTCPPAPSVDLEVQRLQDRVEELEELLGMHDPVPPGLRLSPTESQLLGLFMRREIVSTDGILLALYEAWGDDRPHPHTARVWVCLLNKKLARHGLAVLNEKDRGYYLTREHKDRLRRLFDDVRGTERGRN